MRVDQSSYRAWGGRAHPNRAVAFAIAGTMIRRLMRFRLIRWVARVIPIGVCVLSSGWFFIASQGLSDGDLANALKGALGDIDPLGLAYRMLQGTLGGIGVLMAGMAGAPLIAEDRRSRALPLYFSRPLTHFDYVIGKLLTLVFFLSLVLLLPQICMYLVQLAFASESGAALDQLPVLLRTLVPGLLTCAVLSSVALGASSISEKTGQAVLFYFGIMLVAPMLAGMLAHAIFREMNWYALSPLHCAKRIAMDLVAIPERFEQQISGRLVRMDLFVAWLGVVAWTSVGIGTLVARIRKVEVVS